jgi:hypothetical protein
MAGLVERPSPGAQERADLSASAARGERYSSTPPAARIISDTAALIG